MSGSKLKRRLRLGMVGGGPGAFIGGVHRIAARIDDQYELVAGVFSSDHERSKVTAQELHVTEDRCYDTFTTMASVESARDDGIDVVAIVTPNHLHFEIAKSFLEAGIHVICDKPLTTNLADANALATLVEESDLIFCLTHNYTGYPMVRQARALVREEKLGKIRVVQLHYAQEWLATAAENEGSKQAEWRTDPERSGPAGCVGDIATHAINLAGFITGLELDELSADLHTFVDGRRLDDNAHILLRYRGGARGMLWSSQVATGHDNNLGIHLYGELGSLSWEQQNPNDLIYTPLGEVSRRFTRAGKEISEIASLATRLPAGHPEGYLEGFAQIYRDAAEQITARLENRAPAPSSLCIPSVNDGVEGVRFIEKCVQSSQGNAKWVKC